MPPLATQRTKKSATKSSGVTYVTSHPVAIGHPAQVLAPDPASRAWPSPRLVEKVVRRLARAAAAQKALDGEAPRRVSAGSEGAVAPAAKPQRRSRP